MFFKNESKNLIAKEKKGNERGSRDIVIRYNKISIEKPKIKNFNICSNK